MGRLTKVRLFVAGLAILLSAACSPIYRNHGHVPTDEELAGITVGVDSRETVDDAIGAPSAGGMLEGGDYYYVRSRMKHFGMLEPKENDRQVVAISFDEAGVVKNIERFGLEQGHIVPLSRRVTSSSVEDKGFLRQLLGNIGNFNPGALLSNN